ncbi:MAG: MobF family relaxase, partial [Pseudomonas sp.]
MILNSTKLDGRGNDVKTGAAVFVYMTATEYYLNRDGQALSASRWWGGGAAALGLHGEVDIATMEKLGQGIAPDGTELRQNAGDATRLGWDLTFNPDKYSAFVFSIADASERDDLLDDMHEGVIAGLGLMEQESRVRTGKGGLGPQQKTTGMVASLHTHFGSRDLEPFPHVHALTYNCAQGEDGNWRALHADYMLQHVKAAGALARVEHAWRLRQRGYGIIKHRDVDADGRETGDVYIKLAGIAEPLIDRISTRRKQIVAYQQEHGGTMNQAAIATRKHKDEPTYSELTQMWAKSLKEAQELDPTLIVPTIQELRSKACVLGEEITDEDILKRLHKTESSFTRAQLIERVALENIGRMDAKAVMEEVDAFIKRAPIVELHHHQDHKIRDGEPKYAAQWMLDMEQEIGARGRARMDEVQVKVSPEVVEEAIAQIEAKNGFKFSQEQIDMVLHQTVETGGMALAQGRAGTGKTTAAEPAVLAWQLNGQTVIGVSTAWDAAQQLETDAGIKSFSAEKLLWDLDNGQLELTNRHVVVFDEAGMAGTQVVHRIQTHTDKAGAKLVLQGDQNQLQPVSAGNPFALLAKEVGYKELTEIRRQQHQADRDTANMMYGDPGFELGQQILERLDQQKKILRFDYRKEAIDQLAQDWIQSTKSDDEKLAIGSTRVEVRLMSEAIRDQRRAHGLLGEQEIQFKAKAGGQWQDLKVSEGDRVRFSERSKDMDVVNGTVGIIEGIEPGKQEDSHLLKVRLQSNIPSQDGREVSFDTADYRSLSHAYAMTVHKSQGQGKQEVFHLASPSMTDRHLQLVAFTRTKQNYRMYGAADDIAQMAPRMGQDRIKLNAIDQLKKVEPPAIEIDDKTREQARSFGALLE